MTCWGMGYSLYKFAQNVGRGGIVCRLQYWGGGRVGCAFLGGRGVILPQNL